MRYNRFVPSLLLMSLLCTLAACGGKSGSGQAADPQPAAPPSITSFTATPAKINVGGTAGLSWAVAGATSLSIDQGVGGVIGSGTAVSPSITTRYTLSATNAKGTVTASTSVTVNHPPVLAPISDLNGAPGTPITLALSATDPDGDTLSYTATGLPAGAVLSAATGAFSWTPTVSQTGPFVIVFAVSDGGLASTRSITIAITTNPAALSVLYPVNPALRVGVASSRQTPLLTHATEGMATTYSLVQGALPPGLVLQADGSYSGTPTTAGDYDFTLQAVNDARTATDAIHVSVVPAGYAQALAGDPGVAAFRASASAPAYYVDSKNGLDVNDGRSPGKAWKTIAKLNSVILVAGDVIRLARGSVWEDTLRFDLNEPGTATAPIVVEAYGSGDAPTLSTAADKPAVYVRGSYITLLDLKLTGAKIGIQTATDSQFVTIAGNEMVDTGIGIYAEGSGHKFFSNYIHDLHIIRNTPGGNDDYGAEGIVMTGSNMEAAWNRLVNCIAPSYDYEVDGGAFETWGSGTLSHIFIHHNLADNVDGFMELTNNTDDLVIAHNLIINSRGGLCMHMDDIPGKNYTYQRVRFEHNIVYRNPKVLKSAVFTFLGSQYGRYLPGNDMIMRDNIICCNRRLTYNDEALGGGFVHGHNVYHFTNGGYMGSTVIDPSERIADPLFIDPSKTNFRQQAGGPATSGADGILYDHDLDGVAIQQNHPVSIGAYQFH